MSKDYEDRTKDELQDEARRRGLPVSGKKQEIIDRLTDADEDKGGEDNGDDEQSENREDRTKDELQDEARRRGLPVSGRKQELLDRLADADLEEAKEEDEDDSEDEDKSEDDVEQEDKDAEDEDEQEDKDAKDEDEQEDKDAKDEGETEDGEEQRSPSARPSRRTQLKPMQLAQRARRQLSQLTGHSIEAISGLEPDDGNWRITLELVELARVPRASDVLGSYEVVVDADGDLLGYRRLRRYVRGAASED
jgi:hypothetical protein